MRRLAAVGLALAIVVSACSVEFSIGGKTPAEAASDLIEGEIAAQGGWTLTASCPDPGDVGPGDTFPCTGSTTDGQTIRFLVDVGDDEVDVRSQNVLGPDAVAGTEQDVAAALSQQVGLTLPAENVECGEGPLILPADATITCALTDPANGDVYDTFVTIELGDPIQFDIQVAEQPRS